MPDTSRDESHPESRPERRPQRRPAELPDRVLAPLLARVTQEAMDSEYDERAARLPPRDGETPRGPRVATVAVVGVLGLMVAVAGVQTSRNAEVNDESRATLIARIDNQRDLAQRQQRRISRLRAQTVALRGSLADAGSSEQTVEARLRRLQVRTGFIAVSGEGITITVDEPDDAPDAERIADSDLALLVDGLLASGAEAIAINGQRLSARTGIRSSGVAIKINTVGIAPPYTVEAIGDRRTLEADLFSSPSGVQFAAIATTFGFTYDVTSSQQLRLPASPDSLLDLRSVRALTTSEEDGS